MPKQRTVRDILERVFDKGYDAAVLGHKDLKDTIIDDALAAIKEIRKAEVGKTKLLADIIQETGTGYANEVYALILHAVNQYRQEVLRKIEESE